MTTPDASDINVLQAEVRVDFAKRRRWHLLGLAATALSMILATLVPGLVIPLGAYAFPLPFLIGLLFIVSAWITWRCPACRHTLMGDLSPSYCSRCGIELDAE